jgi:hypothetical protein
MLPNCLSVWFQLLSCCDILRACVTAAFLALLDPDRPRPARGEHSTVAFPPVAQDPSFVRSWGDSDLARLVTNLSPQSPDWDPKATSFSFDTCSLSIVRDRDDPRILRKASTVISQYIGRGRGESSDDD